MSYPEKWWKSIPVPDNDDVEDNSETVKENSEEPKEETLKLRSAYGINATSSTASFNIDANYSILHYIPSSRREKWKIRRALV